MIFQSYGIIIFSIFSSLCILQSILLVIYLQGIKLCPKTRSKIFRPVRPSFCIHTYMYFDLSLSKIWCKNWKQVERQATKKKFMKKNSCINIFYTNTSLILKVRIQVCKPLYYLYPRCWEEYIYYILLKKIMHSFNIDPVFAKKIYFWN